VDKGLRLPTLGADPLHTAGVSILGLVDKGLRRSGLANRLIIRFKFQSLA